MNDPEKSFEIKITTNDIDILPLWTRIAVSQSFYLIGIALLSWLVDLAMSTKLF